MSTSPCPVARTRKPPSPPTRFLKPPHFVSSSTPAADASHVPRVNDTGDSGVTLTTCTSPTRKLARSTQPPDGGAVYVVMNKLSPPRNDRFKPFRTPPCVLASTAMPA